MKKVLISVLIMAVVSVTMTTGFTLPSSVSGAVEFSADCIFDDCFKTQLAFGDHPLYERGLNIDEHQTIIVDGLLEIQEVQGELINEQEPIIVKVARTSEGLDNWLDSVEIGAELIDKIGAEVGSSARGMVTMDVESGRVFYSKNAHAKLPMASTTKIVTAITVIENVKDLDEVVKINDKAIGIEGTSIYIQKGEELTVRELLYGLMLRSGNDCAQALALHVSKTQAEFSQLMNELAVRVGAVNSNFMNPHGLDEEGHYTTAYDLALISAYAMKNESFAEIVATKEMRIKGVEYPRVLLNKNRLLRSNPSIVGVKTGFTSKAGRCFVGGLKDNDMTVVCAVLNCGPMFPESEDLMERAVDEFFVTKILPTETIIVDGEMRGLVESEFLYPLKPSEVERVKIKLDGEFVRVVLDGKEIYKAEYFKIESEE